MLKVQQWGVVGGVVGYVGGVVGGVVGYVGGVVGGVVSYIRELFTSEEWLVTLEELL